MTTVRLRIRDLAPLHPPELVGQRPDLRRLSDAQLLQAAEAPSRGDRLRISTKTGKLMDGDSRYYELMRRAADPHSTIHLETLVTCETYTPDESAFKGLP